MTDQEKCRAIAEWLGLTLHDTTFREYELEIEGCTGNFVEKKCSCGRITRLGKKYTEEDSKPLCYNADYLNTNAAFDLLDELVKRGYRVTLDSETKWTCIIYYLKDRTWYTAPWMIGKAKSKSAAIVEAILVLIEKEKEK